MARITDETPPILCLAELDRLDVPVHAGRQVRPWSSESHQHRVSP